MENELKAFIVSYTLNVVVNITTQERKQVVKSVVILAFDKKEAGDIFVRWAHTLHLYEHIDGVVCQETKKNKYNKDFITLHNYNEQLKLVGLRKADA